MSEFIRVASSEEVTGAGLHAVDVRGRQVVLARTGDGVVRAFPNTCPHLGQPLRLGEVSGRTLECGAHFYAYDLTTGRNTFPGGESDLALQVYDVREVDGEIEVRIPEATPPQPTSAEPPAT